MNHVETITVGNSSVIARIWESLKIRFEIIGYSRAASQLAIAGRYDEAKACMLEVAKLRN